MLPIPLLGIIAEYADWLTVVRLAGTCRGARKIIRKMPISCEFEADTIETALMALEYNLSKISYMSLDSVQLERIGSMIAEKFAIAKFAGRFVQLRTNSQYIMNGIQKWRSCEHDKLATIVGRSCEHDKLAIFDRVIYEILHSNLAYDGTHCEDGADTRSNVRRLDMFNGFRELELSYGGYEEYKKHIHTISDITRNAQYAFDGDTITFRGIWPQAVRLLDEIRIVDTDVAEIAIYAKRLVIINSRVYLDNIYYYPDVEEVLIDENSLLVIEERTNIMFPNAVISGYVRRICTRGLVGRRDMKINDWFDPKLEECECIDHTVPNNYEICSYNERYESRGCGPADEITGLVPINMMEGEESDLPDPDPNQIVYLEEEDDE